MMKMNKSGRERGLQRKIKIWASLLLDTSGRRFAVRILAAAGTVLGLLHRGMVQKLDPALHNCRTRGGRMVSVPKHHAADRQQRQQRSVKNPMVVVGGCGCRDRFLGAFLGNGNDLNGGVWLPLSCPPASENHKK